MISFISKKWNVYRSRNPARGIFSFSGVSMNEDTMHGVFGGQDNTPGILNKRPAISFMISFTDALQKKNIIDSISERAVT
jgi:hypothetical protein